MPNTIEELRKLKQEVKEAETDLARQEGAMESLTAEMKTKFKVKSVEELGKLVEKLDAEVITLAKELDAKMAEAKENYEW